jgi:hypothetical protein
MASALDVMNRAQSGSRRSFLGQFTASDSRAAIAERSTTQRPSVITKNEISESRRFLSFSQVLRPEEQYHGRLLR